MADTTAQMNSLMLAGSDLADRKGHHIASFKEYAGGAVNIAECVNIKCKRYVWVEIWPDGHDLRGSALVLDCVKE